MSDNLKLPDEERIPSLVDNFLQNVHTKNPILDVKSLVRHSRHCAKHGLSYDAWSCLVLLACALGSVAKPFDTAAPLPPIVRPESIVLAQAPPPASADIFAKELHQGESYFILACRRLGGLKHTMLGAQCQFYAGGEYFECLQRCPDAFSLSHVHASTTACLAILLPILHPIPAVLEDHTWHRQQ